jgi:hypothetical protein
MIDSPRRITAALALLATAFILATWHQPSPGSSATRVVASASVSATTMPVPIPGVSSGPTRSASGASLPASLTIASLGVQTSLQPLGLLMDGSLQPPSEWGIAGWYDEGVVPGQIGPAIIAGHIDSTHGPAVFYRLRDLAVGAQVLVTDQDGTVLTFVVDGAEAYAKSQFPTAGVYGPTPDAELKLITCTGTFDSSIHSYLSNLVVTAHLTATT